MLPLHKRDFGCGEAVEPVDKPVDLGFECGDVGGGIGGLGGEDAVDQGHERLLALGRHVGDRELLPVVGIEMDVAASIRTQEVAGRRRVHDAQQILYGEPAAGGLQLLARRLGGARRIFICVPRRFLERIVADIGERVPRHEPYGTVCKVNTSFIKTAFQVWPWTALNEDLLSLQKFWK